MFPYILVAVFLLLLAVRFDINGVKKNRSFWLSIATWVLILFSGLRNELGIDTYSYGLAYNTAPSIFDFVSGNVEWFDFSSQPLWYLFTSLCKTITSSFLLMQMIIAFVFNFLMVRFFKSVSHYVFSCILLFFCTKWFIYNFEVLRESICVALYLNAIVEYGKDKNIKRFLLFAFPTIFIHWFALIMLFVFLIVVTIDLRFSLFISVLLSLMILIVDVSTFEMLMMLTVEQLDSSSEKLNGYLTKIYEGSYNIFFYIQLLVVEIIPPLILLWRYFRDSNISELERKLLCFLPLYLIIGVSTSKLVIAYRLFNYIYPIYLVFVLRALYESFILKNRLIIAKPKRSSRLLFTILLLCFSFSVFSDIRSFIKPVALRQEYGKYDIRYIPYTTVFQESNEERTMYYEYWRNWH